MELKMTMEQFSKYALRSIQKEYPAIKAAKVLFEDATGAVWDGGMKFAILEYPTHKEYQQQAATFMNGLREHGVLPEMLESATESAFPGWKDSLTDKK